MSICIKNATGKAKCGDCNKAIGKESIDVQWSGFRSGGHYHLSCLLKFYLKDNKMSWEDLIEKLMVEEL